MKKLLVKNIGLLATPEGKSAHRGEEQGKIKFLKDAWVLIEGGIIDSVGTGSVPAVEGAEVVDAGGHLVTPGLVDAHTHLIFGGWRQNELGLKLHGASYLDIQNAGGGIQSTTNATRQASEQELAAKASKALDEMMGFGTTTVEAKSGYGLATEHELKALEVIKDLNDHHRMDLVATFMGAHLVPAEYKSNREEYVRLVCEEMMPKVKEQGIAKFCDVFCEADTFTVEESRQVLEAGLKYGLRPKIHADEIEAIGGSQLAGEIGAISAEHLIVCPPEASIKWGILVLAQIMAMLLPIPRKLLNRQLLKAVLKVPQLAFVMAGNLFKLKGANKKFIHTEHGEGEREREREGRVEMGDGRWEKEDGRSIMQRKDGADH
mgnify:CR=1 FL=1